jgi:ArsR family transcriptional regulator
MHDLSDERFFQKHADFCAVFSNPNRLKLVDILAGGDAYTVSELEAAADLSQSAVSQHLKLMRDQGIVEREKRGVHSYYSLADERIVEGMKQIQAVLAERLD